MFQFRHIIDGPSISINNQKGSLVHSAVFPLEGEVRNVKEMQIDGRHAFTDESGKFYDIILLSEGYNVITLIGKDKFNRKVEQRVEIVYKKPESETATATSTKKVAATNNKAVEKMINY